MVTQSSQLVRRWMLTAGMLAGLLYMVFSGVGFAVPPRAGGEIAEFNRVLPWHEAGRDWLIVTDSESKRLTIYDAVDGRLLAPSADRMSSYTTQQTPEERVALAGD